MKKEQKYSIIFEKDCWKIISNNYTYTIKIIKQKNEYYIRLTPYQNTYFQTRLTFKNVTSKVHMTLFAMAENEKLYRHG